MRVGSTSGVVPDLLRRATIGDHRGQRGVIPLRRIVQDHWHRLEVPAARRPAIGELLSQGLGLATAILSDRSASPYPLFHPASAGLVQCPLSNTCEYAVGMMPAVDRWDVSLPKSLKPAQQIGEIRFPGRRAPRRNYR